MNVVVTSGGFDPVHSGHISYFENAKKLGDILIVGVNSDAWLIRKKGKAFMPFKERVAVVKAIRHVDYVFPFNDDDGSAKDLIELVKMLHPNDNIIVANGGDRNENNNSEEGVDGVKFVFGVGGTHKMNSSSDILKRWKE